MFFINLKQNLEKYVRPRTTVMADLFTLPPPPSSRQCTEAYFIVPDWGDKVDFHRIIFIGAVSKYFFIAVSQHFGCCFIVFSHCCFTVFSALFHSIFSLLFHSIFCAVSRYLSFVLLTKLSVALSFAQFS